MVEDLKLEKIMGVVKGGEFKFFGLGKELFFIFSNERLFVLEGSLYDRLFMNVFPLGSFWSLRETLTEQKDLAKRSFKELEEKAVIVLPYSNIDECKLYKKRRITMVKFVFRGEAREFAFPFRIEGKDPEDFFPPFLERLGIAFLKDA